MKCEHLGDDGWQSCRNRPSFLVRIGTRRIDQQWSCGVHLAATVIAMTEADYGRPATVEWKPRR